MPTRDYDQGELTVHWDSIRCSHSAKCVLAAPTVFRPDERPWVDVGGADLDTIVHGVDVCPTGALSYTWHPGAPHAPGARDEDAAQDAGAQ